MLNMNFLPHRSEIMKQVEYPVSHPILHILTRPDRHFPGAQMEQNVDCLMVPKNRIGTHWARCTTGCPWKGG